MHGGFREQKERARGKATNTVSPWINPEGVFFLGRFWTEIGQRFTGVLTCFLWGSSLTRPQKKVVFLGEVSYDLRVASAARDAERRSVRCERKRSCEERLSGGFWLEDGHFPSEEKLYSPGGN